MSQLQHMDAAESIFAQRELEHVVTQAYSVRYPNLQATQFVPVDRSMPAWADVGVYYMIDMVGAAKAIDNYGQNLPRADVKKTEHTWKARRYGIAYGYTLDELKKAAALGMSLDATKATAARRGYEETMDGIGFNGDSALGIVGFNGLANTTSYTVANGAGGTATWASKTPDEIVFDVYDCMSNIVETTSGIGAPDTVLLPIGQYNLIASKRMGDGSDVTILKHILETQRAINPGFDVRPWWRLASAGAGSTDRMVVYRNSMEVVCWYIPEDFIQLPPEQRNLEVIVNCSGKIGSVVSRYPFEISYADGI